MKRIFLLVAGACVAYACTINDKDFQIKGVEANPTFVAPIASGDLSISDFLKDTANIKVKSDGLVYLSYDQSLASQDIRNLIDIPNVSNLNRSLSVPAATYPANQNDYNSTTNTTTVDMGISPEKLTEIAFKSGTLNYSMSLSPNSNFKYAVLVDIVEFKSNSTGAGFSQEVSGSGSIQLSNYTFKSATANKFTLKLTLVVKKNSSAVVIGPGTNLNVTISFAGMNFRYIKGFFGDQIANPPAQTINISAFGTSFQNGASVSFAAPTIDMNVMSQYGVPLKVTFTTFQAQKQGSTLNVITNPASPITINQPAALGDSAITPVSVSNVKPLVDFAPTKFYYKVSGHINAGLISGSNFMADTSKMRVNMHIEIPLYGKASKIILSDTLDLDLGDLKETKIDSASLRASISNQMPLDANIQFYLTDANYVFLDSLLTPSQTGFVKGSTVDSNGELSSPGVFDQYIPLQQAKISKIFQAKKIIVRAKLNTSKNASGVAVDVKFKSQYRMSVKLGLKTKLKLSATF